MSVKRVDGAGKRPLEIALKNLDGKVAKVGWLDGSSYINGMKVAEVAAIQEFGYPPKHIPPRPFFRTTIAEKEKEWRLIAESGSKAIIKGSSNLSAVMEAIGLKAAGDVRKKIATIWEPPLKESTIRARLSRRANKKTVGNLTKPLVDTGFMLGTLTNSVEDES